MLITDWKARGAELAQAHAAQQWEIADWLLAGVELLPGEKVDSKAYSVAEELFPQYARQTLKEWVRVARAYPAYARAYANLSFSHYRAALVNADGKQAEWLQQANDSQPRWSVAELTRRILAAQLPAAPASVTEPESEPKPQPEPESKPAPVTADDEYRVLRRVMPNQCHLGLTALASARNTTTLHIVAEAVAEYLAAHADELESARALDEAKDTAAHKALLAAEKQADRNFFVGRAGATEFEAMRKEAGMLDEKARWRKQEEDAKAARLAAVEAKRLTALQDKAMQKMYPEYCAARDAAADAQAQAEAQAAEEARVAAVEAEKAEWRNNTAKLEAEYAEALVEHAHKEREALRVAHELAARTECCSHGVPVILRCQACEEAKEFVRAACA